MPAELIEQLSSDTNRGRGIPHSVSSMSSSGCSSSESSHSPGSTISPTSVTDRGFPSPEQHHANNNHFNTWIGGGVGRSQRTVQFPDDNGFVDAVPFPYPPRRNVFIEPGSGMRDVPMWLKNLRLHKYTSLFQQLNYDDMMTLTEDQLERQGVTKGARHKIVVCVLKLKERVELLRQLEKDLMEPGGVRTTLAELRQMITTPIRPYPPPGKPEPDQAKIDGVDVAAEELDEENLPAHFTRVLGKLCMQMFAVAAQETEDDCFSTLLHILDRCINHEAFTQAQKRRVISWKHVVKRVWNPSKVNRGSFGPTPSVSPPTRTSSWNKDRRGVPAKQWGHAGSPPRTPRKLNRSYSDTTTQGGPYTANFSCPSQLMQNMNVQYAMAYVLAQAQQMAQSQAGTQRQGYPYSATPGISAYDEIPNLQRTTSMPPVHNVQQMAAMLALAGGQNQALRHPPTSQGLLTPLSPSQQYRATSGTNSAQENAGLQGALAHQGPPTQTSAHERTPTPPGGILTGQTQWSGMPANLQKAHSVPQQRQGVQAPRAAGGIETPLEILLNNYGGSMPDQPANDAVYGNRGNQGSGGSPFHWFASGHCRLEESQAPAGYGMGNAARMADSTWAPLTKQTSAPTGGNSGARALWTPEECPTSPMAFNFEHNSAVVDLNSRMEKLCRSVAEVAIGGLETPEPTTVNGSMF